MDHREQGSTVKQTCTFESDLDYHLVTPSTKSVSRDEMEYFGSQDMDEAAAEWQKLGKECKPWWEC